MFQSTNLVRVQGESLAYTAGGQGGRDPVGGGLAARPFTRRYPYFEVTITAWGAKGCIGVGASVAEYSLGQMPGTYLLHSAASQVAWRVLLLLSVTSRVLAPRSGWKSGSVGLHADDGNLFDGKGHSAHNLCPALKSGDVLGCGVVFSSAGAPEQVFFAVNNDVVGRVAAPGGGELLYPHIGFHSVGERVKFNFKARSPLSASGASAGFVRRRTAPAPRGARQLQELGLRMFASLVGSLAHGPAGGAASGAGAGGSGAHSGAVSGAALVAPLEAVSTMLTRFAPMELFQEWSPPRDPVQQRVDVKGAYTWQYRAAACVASH